MAYLEEGEYRGEDASELVTRYLFESYPLAHKIPGR